MIGIADTGPGIPAPFRPRIFDKFFRLEDHQAEGRAGARGAGIGLYMCRQIVELHGGEIACGSGVDDRGTCISVTLPVQPVFGYCGWMHLPQPLNAVRSRDRGVPLSSAWAGSRRHSQRLLSATASPYDHTPTSTIHQPYRRSRALNRPTAPIPDSCTGRSTRIQGRGRARPDYGARARFPQSHRAEPRARRLSWSLRVANPTDRRFRRERQSPINVAFLLDTASGSMRGLNMARAKDFVEEFVGEIDPRQTKLRSSRSTSRSAEEVSFTNDRDEVYDAWTA